MSRINSALQALRTLVSRTWASASLQPRLVHAGLSARNAGRNSKQVSLKTGMETPKIGVLVQTQHFESQSLVTQQVHCGAMEIHCTPAACASSRFSIPVFRVSAYGLTRPG